MYNELDMASLTACEERLNWDAWGHKIKPPFEQTIEAAMEG